MRTGGTVPTMVDQPFTLDQLTTPPPRRPRRRRTWLIVAAGVATLILIIGAFALTRPGETKPPAPAATRPVTTINISGNLTLVLPEFSWNPGSCSGYRGYDDVQGGAQVVITNPSGATVAVGRLGDGTPTVQGDRATACVFTFSVTAPAGLGFYGVEVSHRGRVQYTEHDVQQSLDLAFN